MSDFNKVELNEYTAELTCDHCESRTVIIVGESVEEADKQIAKFAEHLSKKDGHAFTATPVQKLERTHVTFTEVAWTQLKASDD